MARERRWVEGSTPKPTCEYLEKNTFATCEPIGSNHRRVKKPQCREDVKCGGQFPIRESSSWIWRNDLMLPHEWREFGWPMRYFAQKFPFTRVSEREPTLE
jgi:hypothetical protein